jgi:hypothetical protein
MRTAVRKQRRQAEGRVDERRVDRRSGEQNGPLSAIALYVCRYRTAKESAVHSYSAIRQSGYQSGHYIRRHTHRHAPSHSVRSSVRSVSRCLCHRCGAQHFDARRDCPFGRHRIRRGDRRDGRRSRCSRCRRCACPCTRTSARASASAGVDGASRTRLARSSSAGGRSGGGRDLDRCGRRRRWGQRLRGRCMGHRDDCRSDAERCGGLCTPLLSAIGTAAPAPTAAASAAAAAAIGVVRDADLLRGFADLLRV